MFKMAYAIKNPQPKERDVFSVSSEERKLDREMSEADFFSENNDFVEDDGYDEEDDDEVW